MVMTLDRVPPVDPGEEEAPRTARGYTELLLLAVLVIAVVICVDGARDVDTSAATDLGLIGLLPGAYWAGLGVISCVFAVNLARAATPDWLFGATVVALITPVFGLSAFASDLPRGSTAFRHAGIVDSLSRMGQTDATIDAYFNWPGFFMLGSLFSEATGVSSPIVLTHWAPLYTNLLILPPLLLLMRCCTTHRPTQWVAVWLFFLVQWVGQDYFAPQTYAYLLYLVIIAALLAWFEAQVMGPRGKQSLAGRLRHRLSSWSVQDVALLPIPPGKRVGALFLVIVVLGLVTIPSHQLTPFALLISLSLLGLVHGRTPTVLAVILAVGLAAWLAFMSSGYLAGHLAPMLSEFGDLGVAAEENVSERVNGSPDHILVVRARVALTLGVILFAGVGLWRRWRLGHRDLVPVLMIGGAFALLPMQPYGGEMLLRCYFFALPFLALLAGFWIYPEASRRLAVQKAVAVLALTAILLPALFLTRYGNARIEQFTSAELAAVERTYELADPGAQLFAVASNVPWRFTEYEQHSTHIIMYSWQETPSVTDVATHIQNYAAETPAGGFVIIGESQLAYLEMFGVMPLDAVDQVLTELVTVHGWQQVYRDGTAAVFASPSGAIDAT